MTEMVPTPNPCPTCGQPVGLITITTPEPLSEAEYEDLKRRFQAAYAKDSQVRPMQLIVEPRTAPKGQKPWWTRLTQALGWWTP